MGFWGGLGKVLGVAGSAIAAPFTGGTSLAWLPGVLGAAGAGLGAISQGKAQNRDAQYAGQMDLEQLLMQRDRDYWNQLLSREQEGRAGQSDAWRKLMSAQRVMSPGARPQLSPYSVAPRQATDMEREGANALSQEVLARLMGGNPIPMPERRAHAIDPRLLKAGGMERVSGYLSPILSYLGQPRQPVSEKRAYPSRPGDS